MYHSQYLNFFERARTEWLRHQGFEQDALMRESGIVFAVRRVEIDYLLPARLDDSLVVLAEIAAVSRASLTFEQRIVRSPGTLLCRATVKVACIDQERFRPTAIPAHIREKLSHAHQ